MIQKDESESDMIGGMEKPPASRLDVFALPDRKAVETAWMAVTITGGAAPETSALLGSALDLLSIKSNTSHSERFSVAADVAGVLRDDVLRSLEHVSTYLDPESQTAQDARQLLDLLRAEEAEQA